MYSKKLDTFITKFKNGIEIESQFFHLLRAFHHLIDCDQRFIKEYEFKAARKLKK